MVVFCALIFVNQLTISSPLTIKDGTIRQDTEFYYKDLSQFPSEFATVEYDIMYSTALIRPRPILDIYTTTDNKNLIKRCSNYGYGQLRNEHLHSPLELRSKPLGFTTCLSNPNGTDIIHCHGKTAIRDYIPRRFGFSFGFECVWPKGGSLRGLTYNISIYDESNRTICHSMVPVQNTTITHHCGYLYQYMTLPNLIGHQNWSSILERLQPGSEIMLFSVSSILDSDGWRCHDKLYQALCYVLVPKCDPIYNTTTHLCKEMCEDIMEGCMDTVLSKKASLRMPYQHLWKAWTKINLSNLFSCDYLPSRHEPIPCFYKPVVCTSPPNVTNAITVASNRTYEAKTQVEYSCESDQYQMEGNGKITCLYSGQWSEPPRCLKMPNTALHPLYIVIPILSIPIFIFVAIIIKFSRAVKSMHNLSRNKTFDAYVCFDFDTDNDFVLDAILPELEGKDDSSFTLCLHSRDFVPGQAIKDNIQDAIQNSNSAIVILSQGFINSIWCKYEFEQCFIENLKDPAFKLFVIMMQPAEELVNMSEYMKKYLSSKTYLAVNDPKLFKKITKYLTWVKEPKEKAKYYEALDLEEVETFNDDE